MTQTPTKAEELARELEQQQVSNWIHSTGTPPRVNGTKPDPLCQDAAAELRRLSAVEAERDALQSKVQEMALQALADDTQHREVEAERDALRADAERWQMLLFVDADHHRPPGHRQHSAAYDAYNEAFGAGFDRTTCVDAAIDAAMKGTT